MPSKSPWTKLVLSTSLVNELNVWKDAFSAVRGRNVTYSEIVSVRPPAFRRRKKAN